jgi:hypothetical protein
MIVFRSGSSRTPPAFKNWAIDEDGESTFITLEIGRFKIRFEFNNFDMSRNVVMASTTGSAIHNDSSGKLAEVGRTRVEGFLPNASRSALDRMFRSGCGAHIPVVVERAVACSRGRSGYLVPKPRVDLPQGGVQGTTEVGFLAQLPSGSQDRWVQAQVPQHRRWCSVGGL